MDQLVPFHFAIRLALVPPAVVKPPPTRTRPSACTAREKTMLLSCGAKELSKEPSRLSRAIFGHGTNSGKVRLRQVLGAARIEGEVHHERT